MATERRVAGFGLDGMNLHTRVAEQIAAQPRPLIGRQARNLGLVTALAALVPVNVLALVTGVGAGLTLGLALTTLAVATVVHRVFLREYGIDLFAPPGSRRNRLAGSTFRRLPAMHGLAAVPARASRVRTAH